VRKVGDNGGYEGESHTATMTLQNRARKRQIFFINTDHEKIQLPVDHYGYTVVVIMSHMTHSIPKSV